MNSVSTTSLILSKLTEYGTAVFIIISVAVSFGVAMLVFRFGARKIGIDNGWHDTALHEENMKLYMQIKNSEFLAFGGKNGDKTRNTDELEDLLFK